MYSLFNVRGGLNVIRQSICLLINPLRVNNFAALFNCTPEDGASDFMLTPTCCYVFQLTRTGAFSSVAWYTGAQLKNFFCLDFQCCCLTPHVSPRLVSRYTLYLSSLRLCLITVLNRDSSVYRVNDSLTS